MTPDEIATAPTKPPLPERASRALRALGIEGATVDVEGDVLHIRMSWWAQVSSGRSLGNILEGLELRGLLEAREATCTWELVSEHVHISAPVRREEP